MLAAIAFCLISCQPQGYSPQEHLSAREQDAIVWSIIRYLGRPPEGSSNQNLFSPEFDSHYREQQSFFRLDAFYIKGDTSYFMLSRRAPSLEDKRVSVAGKLVIAEDGVLAYYTEVFRTFKMPDPELKEKSLFLFDLMVRNEDLSRYERRRNAEEFIEFPDALNYYDDRERRWKARPSPSN